jgi:hypothetical protein
MGEDLKVLNSIWIVAGVLVCPWPENICPPIAEGYWVASMVTSCTGSELVRLCGRVSAVFELEVVVEWSSLSCRWVYRDAVISSR